MNAALRGWSASLGEPADPAASRVERFPPSNLDPGLVERGTDDVPVPAGPAERGCEDES